MGKQVFCSAEKAQSRVFCFHCFLQIVFQHNQCHTLFNSTVTFFYFIVHQCYACTYNPAVSSFSWPRWSLYFLFFIHYNCISNSTLFWPATQSKFSCSSQHAQHISCCRLYPPFTTITTLLIWSVPALISYTIIFFCQLCLQLWHCCILQCQTCTR